MTHHGRATAGARAGRKTWRRRFRDRPSRSDLDNQYVQGRRPYVIDKFDFQVAVDNAKAAVQSTEADLEVKKAQASRRESQSTAWASIEEKQTFDGSAKMAQAASASAKASLSQAEINLQRTEVRSPVDGYVTNLLMRVGDFAQTGSSNVL